MIKENNKEKDKRRVFIFPTSVFITLALVLAIGFSVAKYNETKTFDSSVNDAKFVVNISDSGINLRSDGYDAKKIASNKIAPGTEGTINIDLNVTGTEVSIAYDLSFTNLSNIPANMYFEYDGIKYQNLNSLATAISGTIDANASNKIVGKTIKWVWPYETTTSLDGTRTTLAANDIQDTNDGKAGNTMSIKITAHVYQIDPR